MLREARRMAEEWVLSWTRGRPRWTEMFGIVVGKVGLSVGVAATFEY